MPLEEPSWWYAADADDPRVKALKPASRIYAWAGARRLQNAKPYRSPLPVICIGNFTAGGTGKTPLSLLIARLLQARGHSPAFLTRGYSGRQSGPVWVNPSIDTAREVGDEPLLLAEAAPTMVARDRPAGARAIEAGKTATHIIMDDGLQNPTLAKSLAIAVVDGVRGLGNGEVIPAGPLRAPLDVQFDLTDAIVVNGGGSNAPILLDLRSTFPGPVLSAAVEPDLDGGSFAGARVVAYAGIGNPSRFTASLKAAGAEVVAERFFKDHHAYREDDARELVRLAASAGARLMTTQKDLVRLKGTSGALADLAQRSEPLRIVLAFDVRDIARLEELIDPATIAEG